MTTLTDLAYLERFCKGDRARMERYVNMYIQGSPAMFADLGSKLAAGDAEGLAIVAHSLRPQVNYMGATRLFDLLTTIETMARAEGAAACTELVKDGQALNRSAIQELTGWLHPEQA